MKIKRAADVEARDVEMEGASRVKMRMLIGPDDGAPNFNMRMFEVAPGGHTPLHTHAWEHEVYILAGEATVCQGAAEHKAPAGDCVFVPAGDEHQFRNAGADPVSFLCLVPRT